MSGSVWVVIVNYCTGDLVVDCLSSLEKQIQDLNGGRVLVVDNASSDGSVECIESVITKNIWQDWAGVLSLKTNGGYASGNNAGIAVALSSINPPDYVLLLNPDTIAYSDSVKQLVKFLDTNSEVGITGSSIENVNRDREISAHRFPSPLSELENSARLGFLTRFLSHHIVSPPLKNYAHECDWISGASFMLRCSMFEDIGKMDDSFFLYFEEIDYCQRAKSHGWSTWYIPESRIMHIEGAATGICSVAQRRPTYWYDSRRRFFVKYYGISGWLIADLMWSIGRVSYLFRRAFRLGAQGETRDPKWFMFDLLWGDLRALLTGQVWKIPRVHN